MQCIMALKMGRTGQFKKRCIAQRKAYNLVNCHMTPTCYPVTRATGCRSTPPAYMYHCLLEVFAVISPIHLVGARLVQVVVVVWGHDAKCLFLLSVGALYQLWGNNAGKGAGTREFHMTVQEVCTEKERTSSVSFWTYLAKSATAREWRPWRLARMSDLIINVEVPLALILAHHPRLLQEEVWDFATIRLPASAELNFEIFSLVGANTPPPKRIKMRWQTGWR